jgi:hypothetical protein
MTVKTKIILMMDYWASFVRIEGAFSTKVSPLKGKII